MKRGLTILLSIVLILSMALPASASEPSSNTEAVQTLLAKMKTIFNIDDTGKKFTYNTEENNDSKVIVYDFNWADEKDSSDISVKVDQNGFVRYYSKGSSMTYGDSETNIPKISKKEALDTAYDKVLEIYSDAKDQISKDMANVSNSYGNDSYCVSFNREKDGIAVYNNSITLYIDSMTGDLVEYSVNDWALNIKASDDTKLLSKDDVKKAFNTNMPLELQYVTGYNEKTEKQYTYLVYAPAERNSDFYIDARTGEKVKINQERLYYANGKGGAEATADCATTGSLSKEEIEETEKHSNFITKEKAINVLSNIANLSFDKTLKVDSASTYSQKSSYTDATNYVYNLSFNNDKNDGYCNASFNAETGELLGYNHYVYTLDMTTNTTADAKSIKDIGYDKSKTIADSFLSNLKSEKYAQSKFSEPTEKIDNQGTYSFMYYRLVNGIPFYNDYLSVTVDGTTSKVTGYDECWSDAKFDSASGTLTKEQALDSYDAFFSLTYCYMPVTTDENNEWTTTTRQNSYTDEFELIPVYSYVRNAYVDAKSGKVLGTDLSSYVKTETYTNLDNLYPQLNGHYAKDIVLKLFDMGIEVENKEFDPDAYISTAEFENLAAYLVQNHYYYVYSESSDDASSSEKSSAPLTRMEAIKIIINKLGYEKVAQKADMFNCTFDDKADIASSDIGYAAMAKGFGISQGNDNKLLPNNQITYAEAFIMIYNALNAK